MDRILHQRVASRWLRQRQARRDPLDSERVEKFRKEFLLLLKNADRAASFDMATAEEYRRAVRRWQQLQELYAAQIREDLEGRIRQAERPPESLRWVPKADIAWAKRYLEMQPLWNFLHELRSVPNLPRLKAGPNGSDFEEPEVVQERLMDFYRTKYPNQDAKYEVERYLDRNPLRTRVEAEKASVEEWAEEVRKWATRARSKARVAWKYLQELAAWTVRTDWYGGGGGAVPLVTVEEERVTLEGFSMVFRGFDDSPEMQNYLPGLKEALKRYRQRASTVLPLMLKRQLPMLVDWTFNADFRHSDAAATYESTHIRITPWGLGNDVKHMVRMLAHEMGHHLYQTTLSQDMQTFWRTAVRGDYQDLDLREALKTLERLGSNTSFIDRELAEADPILYLQLGTLIYDMAYKDLGLLSARDIREYLEAGKDPRFRVPASPISAYAGKNEEEAFCDALGHLVGYGPSRLPDKVLGWLKVMLPAIKFASAA